MSCKRNIDFDRAATQAVLAGERPASDGGGKVNWLDHYVGSGAAKIDEMLLTGATEMQLREKARRAVRQHIQHLRKEHGLPIIDVDGLLRFDRTGLKVGNNIDEAGAAAKIHDGTARPRSSSKAAPQWVAQLLSSDVFEEQKRLGGRAVPSNDIFCRFLAVLDGRGGKMTLLALSRALDCPPVRLRGLLAIVQRVLNVDGYAVISRDGTSDTIELNRDLLRRQFNLV